MMKRRGFAACLVFLVTACARDIPPAMSPAASLPLPGAGQASIVFVRPPSPCDTSEYSIVVDDAGHFVGNVASGTQSAIAVTPGPHVFYSWSNIDLRAEKYPTFNPVAAIRMNALASQTEYVALVVQRRGGSSSGRRCNPRPYVAMKRGKPTEDSDFQEALHETQPLVPDQGAGQVALNSDPALLRAHLEMGQSKLRAIDDFRASKKIRTGAEQPATDDE